MNKPDLPDLTSPSQLGAVALQRERVEVPEWGCRVWVWELTGEQLDEYRMFAWRQHGNKVKIDLDRMRSGTARLLAMAIRTPNGDPMFDQHTGPDQLMRMGAASLAKLAAVANRLSGLDEDDDASAEGNSVPAQSGSSNGTAPSPSAEPEVSFSAG